MSVDSFIELLMITIESISVTKMCSFLFRFLWMLTLKPDFEVQHHVGGHPKDQEKYP